MQKPKNQKLKTYTALALALSLASPISVFATGDTELEQENPQTSSSESIIGKENQEIKAYNVSINPIINEDDTKITYDINLEKNTEEKAGLRAQIYLPESSNLESIKVISDNTSKEIKTTEDIKNLNLNLGEDATNLKLEATIKENATDNLFFDLSLVDSNQKFIHADRISHNIKTVDDKKTLEKVKNTGLVSNISGKLVSADELEWTGYLINPTGEDLKGEYELKPSDTQNIEGSKLKIVSYALDENGNLIPKEENKDLSNIGYTIPGHNLLKFSFKTKAKEDATEFTVNGSKLTRELENKEETKKEEPKADKPNEEVKNPEKPKAEEPTPAEVEEMIEELQEGCDDIVEALEEADVDLDKELKESSNTPSKEQDKPSQDNKETKDYKELKTVISDDKASKEDKSNQAQETQATEKSEKENKDKNVKKDEKEKAVEKTTEKTNDEVDFDKLTREINAANKEIVDLLKENGIVSPIVVETQNIFTTNTNQATTDIEKLTKEILDATVEIEKLARQIYGDEAYDSVIKKQSQAKDTNLDKLIADITQTNTEIESTLLEAFKEEEDTYTDQEVRELIQILNKLSELKENTSKAIEKEDKKDIANSLNKTPILGEDKTKNIKDVKTVTLDPLDQATINDITKDITNPIFKNKVLKIIREAGL